MKLRTGPYKAFFLVYIFLRNCFLMLLMPCRVALLLLFMWVCVQRVKNKRPHLNHCHWSISSELSTGRDFLLTKDPDNDQHFFLSRHRTGGTTDQPALPQNKKGI